MSVKSYIDSLYQKVDKVPYGYLEYRLTYAPEGYVFCALDRNNGVYVKTDENGKLEYETQASN